MSAVTARCGPCKQDMVEATVMGVPVWVCPKCHAWTPRKPITPYRKG